MILFFGDIHGKFNHIDRVVNEHHPSAIILLGDIESQRPLDIVLEKVLNKTEVWFIHGNHDTDRSELMANLTDSKLAHRNLHGRVAEIDGVRVAGLGGVFREDIWLPDSANSEPRYESYADYSSHLEREFERAGNLNRDCRNQCLESRTIAKLQKHRSTIFSQVYYELAAQEADVLVSHEAPSCHPHGSKAIDELAQSMRVTKAFHGHHHDNLSYQSTWHELGFEAYGVGLRGVTDMCGCILKAGELDELRLARQRRAE